MARHLISSIKALLRGDEMTRFITIKWRESLGNRFWSSMCFCSRKMAIDAKRDELNGKTSQKTLRRQWHAILPTRGGVKVTITSRKVAYPLEMEHSSFCLCLRVSVVECLEAHPTGQIGIAQPRLNGGNLRTVTNAAQQSGRRLAYCMQ